MMLQFTGYIYQVDEVLDGLVDCLDQTALPLLQWNEEFSFVEKRLPEGLVQDMEVLVNEHAATDSFPGKLLVHLLRNAVQVRFNLVLRQTLSYCVSGALLTTGI